MKKFIAIALMLAMCLGLFAACVQEATPTEPVETKSPLASAAAYLKTMYKDKAGKVLRDFELVSVVTIGDTKYDIEWTTDAAEENVKIVAGENGMVTIDINEKPAEQVDFTLTATVKDTAGNSEKTSLSFYIEAVEPEVVGTVFADTPVVGTAYKFALVQANKGTTLYFTGEMDGFYLAMSEDSAAGVDVVLETAEGGYYISFTKDGAKKYVDIIPREGQEGKVNVVIADAPTAVYAWDAERKTMTTTVQGNPWYLGTYGDYTTISASATSYIEDVTKIGVSQFPAGFATVGASAAPVFVDAPAVGTAYKYGLIQANKGTTLYFTGEMDGYYLAMSEDSAAGVDVVLETAEGGYYISFTKDGAKKYIDIVPREGQEGKVNVVIADAPTAVYTWDAERKTMTTTVQGNPWYLGTYGDYTTISASATSYIEDVTKIGVSQFPAGFATVSAGAAKPTAVDTPAVDTAYKFGLVQANKGATLFFTGEMDGYYLAMSENAADGVEVKLETAEGGYYISFTKDGAKKYIDIIPREGQAGKVNVVIADAPTAVYAWDAERKTMTTTVDGNPWYLGTYGDYTTISASATSYIEDVSKIGISQFPAGFFK